jgi:hypothetical protein
MDRHAGKDLKALLRLLEGYRTEVGNLERKLSKKPFGSQDEKWGHRYRRLDELTTVLIPRIIGIISVPA